MLGRYRRPSRVWGRGKSRTLSSRATWDVARSTKFGSVRSVSPSARAGRRPRECCGGGACGRRGPTPAATTSSPGPVSDGVAPAAARRRAVHQSVRASSARAATPPRCGRRSGGRPRPRLGPERRAEGDRGACPGVGRLAPLAKMRPVPSRWTGTTGTPRARRRGRRRRPGGPGPSRRGCGRPRGR